MRWKKGIALQGPAKHVFDPGKVEIKKRWAKKAKLPKCPDLKINKKYLMHKSHDWNFSFNEFYKLVDEKLSPEEIAKIVAPKKWEKNYIFGPAHANIYLHMVAKGFISDKPREIRQKAKWTEKDRIADLRGETMTRDGESVWFGKGYESNIARSLAFARAEGVSKARPTMTVCAQ